MVHTVLDRRLNGKNKSSVNRQRFLRRVKEQVKDSVKRSIQDGNIEDIISDQHENINVPIKDIKEPHLHHAPGGIVERVFPGNKEFIKGDQIQRPRGQDGDGGREGSPDGEGEDGFTFSISREEFLELFFEDLELPNLIKTNLATITETVWKRAGFVSDGSPSRLNVVRSMKQASARRQALRNPKKRKLKELEEALLNLQSQKDVAIDASIILDLEKQIENLNLEIAVLKKRIKAVPFIDDMDLRYHNYVKVSVPTTQAVMFCVMDVSGSMGEEEKDIAKRFFMLLYLFLTKNYERIDLIFIRHHTEATEVTQEEFFHSRESGGTIVSPALKLVHTIITERYDTRHWNVYVCQASDGDNVSADNADSRKELESLLHMVQYFAYTEIGNRDKSTLWNAYDGLMQTYDNFSMLQIGEVSQIYSVFRKLFEKK